MDPSSGDGAKSNVSGDGAKSNVSGDGAKSNLAGGGAAVFSNGPSPNNPNPWTLPISAAEIRSEFAHHDPAVARLNNGSFGSCPSSVLAAQSHWQRLFLRQPDHFYFNLLQPSLLRSRLIVKDLINAGDVDEVSLVDNATTAAAVVLQKICWAFNEGSFSEGDAVVMLHYAYGSIKKSIHAYVDRAGGHVIEVPLPFPITSDKEIVREFHKALAFCKLEGRRVRLAVIDHITSMPSVVIPVKELTRICREEGVDQVFIDGAHSIGNVEVDVRDIGADFFTSNLHKWYFCPPSVAFLHSRKSSASADIHHPVVSDRHVRGLLLDSGWIGTKDYSAQLVVHSAIEFVDRFEGGIEEIRRRNHEKVVEIGKMLAKAWGTCLGSPPEMCSSMLMVGMPWCMEIWSDMDSLKLRDHLREKFQVEVPIYYNPPKGCEVQAQKLGSTVTGYARISHQVYNVEEDYYRLRDAVTKLVLNGFTCRMLSS